MQVIIICIVVAVLLFVGGFITRRRFGLLGLALAAGSILSTIWGDTASLLVGAAGIRPSSLTTAVTLSALVLLPSIILLFHGATYKSMPARIIGALLFMLLALAFLITPLSPVLNVTGFGLVAYEWLANNKTLIIGAGLIIAIIDLFLTKPVSHSIEKKGKH